jgi:GDPmannose 4,6-dehydratase
MQKRALITGITGQDGSYLAELLLRLGYEVHGVVRRSSTFNTSRIDHLHGLPQSASLKLHHGDLLDTSGISALVHELKPQEIYNLAAQSHVRVSFDMPMLTSEVTGLASLSLLEAVRQYSPDSKLYQASSSEMFGASPPPQSETTAFYPRSPYGVSKSYAFWMTKNYRESYGLFASNGILFNHESPRRGETFVTRKITRAAARIRMGLDTQLKLGNTLARRDWGYAPDYVAGMWMMLQQDVPMDLVLGTGTSTSVQEWVDMTFLQAGLEKDDHLEFDGKYSRPSEVDDLIADASLANSVLGWKTEIMPAELNRIMFEYDLRKISEPQYVDEVVSPLWDRLLS